MERESDYFDLIAENSEIFSVRADDGIQLLTSKPEIQLAQSAQEQNLMARGRNPSEATIGILFEDEYIRVVRDAVKFPNGKLGTYIRILHLAKYAGVAVLPIHDRKVILLRHFRHATRRWHWEIPRGFASSDDPEATALSELREETGYTCSALQRIGIYFPDSGMLARAVYIYAAQVSPANLPQDIEESISDLQAFSLDSLHEMMINAGGTGSYTGENVLNDGFTISAIMFATARGILLSRSH